MGATAATDSRGTRGRGVAWWFAVAAACAVAACKSTPPGGAQSSNQNNFICPPPVLAWTGVKVVNETLAPKPGADPAAPIAVAAGQCGTIYVQWNSTAGATVSQFSASGTEAAPVTAYTMGDRAGRALAVPICTNSSGHKQDCPLLATDQSGPNLHVRDCLHSTVDFSVGSSLGMIIGGGGRRAFMAERCMPSGAATPALAVTPMLDSPGCVYRDDEGSLYASPSDKSMDGYSKGRVVPLPGVASGFTVGAAARLGPDGVVVAGIGGTTGPAWIVSLDASLVSLHQGSVAVGGNLSAVVASVAVDGAGNVFVCGTSRSRVLVPLPKVPTVHPKQIPVTTQGWIAQGTPDLATWATLTMPVAVEGCAFAPSGKLVVSGTYSGTYQGHTSKGTDVFLALVTPGTGGAAPAVAAFSRHGTSANEPVVSAPFVGAGGDVFLAGVTRGDWGAAIGAGQNKVFVARFDAATLALH